ncbi:hypothetical protein WMF31_17415 [Sorangium sp. So ce1036]|uniref:hypothetical protein n=1 Tax=Sorangium sp. So ce1036 TaxID=3133328 RepID=UPI003F0C7697
MMKKLAVGALGAVALAGALVSSNAEATCTIDSECKVAFGCAPCSTAWALGITGTAWQVRSTTDINGARTSFRTRRTTAGNGGGLTVEATEVGSSFHTVYGDIACSSNTYSELIEFHETGSRTVFCPSGTTPVRADARIYLPDELCPFDQICAFN